MKNNPHSGGDGGAEGTVPSLQHQRLRLATGAKSVTAFQLLAARLATPSGLQQVAGRVLIYQHLGRSLRVALVRFQDRLTIFANITEALAAKGAAEAVGHG